MLGTSNLERALSDFEKATGVHPILGGTHPSGTQNALVSLGRSTYLELIAPGPDLSRRISSAILPNSIS
jgi:hypothetical protein